MFLAERGICSLGSPLALTIGMTCEHSSLSGRPLRQTPPAEFRAVDRFFFQVIGSGPLGAGPMVKREPLGNRAVSAVRAVNAGLVAERTAVAAAAFAPVGGLLERGRDERTLAGERAIRSARHSLASARIAASVPAAHCYGARKWRAAGAGRRPIVAPRGTKGAASLMLLPSEGAAGFREGRWHRPANRSLR
jgi:hypothetical protein